MFGSAHKAAAPAWTPRTWAVPENTWLYELSVDWRTPLVVAAIYAAAVTWASRRVAARGPQPPTDRRAWSLFRAATVAHNVLLALFSLKTFVETAPAMARALFGSATLYNWFCDVGDAQNDTSIAFWTWVFYLSKYYELLDTAILLAKGRPSSFLQTYHHAGAILSMWMLTVTRAYGAWVFVVFNSFIHTLMYSYYTLTCLGYAPSWKRTMTQMQIAQFFIGLPIAVAYILIPGCIRHDPRRNRLAGMLGISGRASHVLALVVNFAYVAYLIVLFLDFSRRTYAAKKKSA